MTIAVAILAGLLGLLASAPVNIVADTLPEEDDAYWRPARCHVCQATRPAHYRIPIIGPLGQRRRPACGHATPWRPLAVNVALPVILVALWLHFQTPGELAASLAVFVFMAIYMAIFVLIFVTDFEGKLIFDRVSAPAIYAALPLTALRAGVSHGATHGAQRLLGHVGIALLVALVGGVVLTAFFYLLYRLAILIYHHEEGLGFGDVKLAAIMGLVLGVLPGLRAVFIGTLLAAVIGLLLIVTRLRGRRDTLPLGTYLVAGVFVAMLTFPLSQFS